MVQYLLGTHTGQLLVLRDTTLVWAASLEYTPVQLATGAFRYYSCGPACTVCVCVCKFMVLD